MRIHPHDLLLQELDSACPETREKCLAHLSGCAECQAKLRLLLQVRPIALRGVLLFGRGKGRPTNYEPALEDAAKATGSLEEIYARERAEAPGLYAELIQHPVKRRNLLVRNCPRFRTWGFCEALLYRSREQNFQDAVLGESLALLAVEVLDHLDPASYGSEPLEDLRARAWSYVGNSRRVQTDFPGAEKAFAFAFAFLKLGTGDPLEKAMLLDLKASFLTKRGQFTKALSLLRRAMAIFLEVDETHRAGRALVKMSMAHTMDGAPEKAIPLLHQALTLIDPAREPRLLLAAWHNLIDDLTETGQCMEAQKLLVKARPLYLAQPWTKDFRRWTEGKIARGLGQLDQAEALFLAARSGFLAGSSPYDLALVSLELSSLYAEQERMADLKRIAEETVSFFSSRQVHREAMAALAYWRQAVEAERACVSVVAGVGTFLAQLRHNPELRFQAP